jgi:alcohol dehydrogenase YqhD (iron-dependent ADH family)
LTYDENERKRESTVKEAIEKCRCFYVENVSQELNQVCVESEKFDELSNGLKQKTFKQFNDFYSEDKNSFETNFAKVSVRKKFNLN